jgi:HK97 family phage major capsid protein
MSKQVLSTQEQIEHLESTITEVGKTMNTTLEEWRAASESERSAIEDRLKGFEQVTSELKEMVDERRRTTLPGSEPTGNPEKDFSFARATHAIRTKNWDGAGVEKEIFDAMRTKAMSSAVDSAGGFVVPEQAVPQVIERLKAAMVTRQLGARTLPATGSPVTIPRVSTSATAYWLSGENSTITASDLGLQEISMTPKSCATRTILSNQLLELSAPAADTIIQDDIVSQLAIALDKAVIEGTGASGQPLGIINDPDILTEAISATVTYEEMVGFVDALAVANSLRGKLGWAMHPSLFTQLMKLKSENNTAGTDNLEVSRHAIDAPAPTSILGYPYATTTSFTAATDANSVVFGNWDDVFIAEWGGIRLAASEHIGFDKDQTQVRAVLRADVGLRHPESFCVAS